MGSEWQSARLGDIADIIDSRHKTPRYTEVGTPMVRVVDVRGGKLDLGETKKVSPSDYIDYSKGRDAEVGDLIISRVGSYGNIAYVNDASEQFCLGQNTALIVPKVHWRYLYYQLISPATKLQIEESVVGAVQKTISLKSIKALNISIPPLPEQKAIAHILGTLDDKIELNRRMNATLEGMAQALFKSWFVDFDPVIDNALAAGNPIPDELAARADFRRQALANGTANREVAKTFPAAFRETESMGWIPEGWDIGKITDIADLNSESWSNKTHPDHVNYVDLANTKNGRINEVFPYDYSEAPSRARRVLKVDDTIIGTVRPGNRSFAYIHEDGLTGSTGFAVLRPKLKACRSYVYLRLTQDDVIDHFAHLADGGAYPAIRPEVVGNLETVTFTQELMELFDRNSYPLIEKIGQHQRETATLTDLRDTLLPKLISGELGASEPINSPRR